MATVSPLPRVYLRLRKTHLPSTGNHTNARTFTNNDFDWQTLCVIQNDIHELVVPTKYACHAPARIELDCSTRYVRPPTIQTRRTPRRRC